MNKIEEYIEEIKMEIANLTPENEEQEIVEKVKEYEENLRAEKTAMREAKIKELNVKLDCLNELALRVKEEEEAKIKEEIEKTEEETQEATEQIQENLYC